MGKNRAINFLKRRYVINCFTLLLSFIRGKTASIKVAEHSFDTYVSFTFFSKTLDPSVAKNGSKQVNNTNFGFLKVKLTYVPLPWQHE